MVINTGWLPKENWGNKPICLRINKYHLCNYKTIFGPKYYISYFIQKLVIFLIRYFFVTPPLCSRVFLAWPLNQLPMVKLLLIIILTFHTWKVYLAMALSWHFHICLCYLWNQHFSGWVKCINLQLLQRENLPHQNSLDGKYVRFCYKPYLQLTGSSFMDVIFAGVGD